MSNIVKKVTGWIEHHIIKNRLTNLYLLSYSKKVYKEYLSNFSSVALKHNKKIRVGFFIQRSETFDAVRTIFNHMVNCSDKYDVVTIVLPRFNQGNGELKYDSLDENIKFSKSLSNNQHKTIISYEGGHFIDLSLLDLDYLFLCVPYEDQYPIDYNFKYLHSITRLCYVPYAYTIWSDMIQMELSFPLNLLESCDYIFADNFITDKYLKSVYKDASKNNNRIFSYYFGFPSLDLCEESKNNLFEKVLWIPRWTSDNKRNTGSSFMKYKDDVTAAIEENSNTYIVRPHPLMFDNYLENGIMSLEEIEDFKNKVNRNGSYLDNGGDYFASIKKADILLADYSSVIIQYFLMNKPVIYLDKPKHFHKKVRYVCNSFYYANDWNEISKIITNLKNGIDSKKQNRRKCIDRFKSQCIENSGIKIAEFLYLQK